MSEGNSIINRLNIRKNVYFALGEFSINVALVFFGYRLLIDQGGLEAVGVWATLYALVNIVRLGDAGVAVAATRFLALWDISKERNRIRVHAETALITNVVQFGVLSLAGYFVMLIFAGRMVGADHVAEAENILPWMFFGFFLLNVSGTVLGLLQGIHQGYRRSQLSVFGTAIQLGAVLVLVPSHGLMGLAIAQILQHGAVTILGWRMARREMGSGILPTGFDASAFRTMLGYSIKAQVVNIANGLVEPVAKLLVGHYGGMATQGLFELAYKTVLLPRNLIASGVTATIPAMTTLFHEGREELRRLYARAVRLSSVAMGLAALALCILAPVPSQLWLGRVDTTYWLYVGLLAVGFFCNALGIPAYVLSMASGHMRSTILVTTGTLVGLLVSGILLGEMFAGTGAVGASAGAIGLCGIAIWLTNRGLIVAGGSKE